MWKSATVTTAGAQARSSETPGRGDGGRSVIGFPGYQRSRPEPKAPEGAVAGAGTGGVIGGTLGWIAGIGALAIPGVGPFIAAGPIMAALGGAAIGAAAGGIAGALIGMGIPELEAKRYEGKVKAGNLLISVHTESSEEIASAKKIFSQAGAQDICATGEASVPKTDDEFAKSRM